MSPLILNDFLTTPVASRNFRSTYYRDLSTKDVEDNMLDVLLPRILLDDQMTNL